MILTVGIACAPATICAAQDTAGHAEPGAQHNGLVERAAFRWQREPGRSLALIASESGNAVWRFHYGDGLTKPYFHPVRPVSGPVITAAAPTDHPWHYGLWLSWKTINGLNYWEESRETGEPAGRTEWSDVRLDTETDGSARIRMNLRYRPPARPPVLTEARRIEVGAPDRNGAYFIDWRSTFTAEREARLDRTPPPGHPGSKRWGGYAGLSVRFADGLDQPRTITPNGPAQLRNGRARVRAIAAAIDGVVKGEPAGLAMLEHPANPRFPTRWYAIVNETMTYLNAALLHDRPLSLKAGASFTLRYRLIVHPGRWDAPRLRRAYRVYQQTWE